MLYYVLLTKGGKYNMKRTNNIITFDTPEQFEKYISEKILIKNLGYGTEGNCYLSAQDNNVYKIFHPNYEQNAGVIYDITKIITSKDLEINSFIFPDELYAVKKRMVGLKQKHIAPNLFNIENISENPDSISQIDFNKLLNAYYIMLKDIEKLSAEKIQIYDLPYNLMFTGEKLFGIDTLGYTRVEYNPIKQNLVSLNLAITLLFHDWLDLAEENELYNETNTEKYIKGIQKILKK